MSDTQDADPEGVLYELAERVERIESLVQDQQEYRLDLSKGTSLRKAAEFVEENPGCTSSELGDDVHNSTRILTRLYHSCYVDRRPTTPYEYFLNERGRVALNRARSDEQSTLDDGYNDGEDESPNPWDNFDIGEAEYLALELINEYDGNPRSKDIVDDFTGAGFSSAGNSISQLATLNTKGYVERTPKPYRYWLTDDGKEILNSEEQ
jgi:hypothetical protein